MCLRCAACNEMLHDDDDYDGLCGTCAKVKHDLLSPMMELADIVRELVDDSDETTE